MVEACVILSAAAVKEHHRGCCCGVRFSAWNVKKGRRIVCCCVKGACVLARKVGIKNFLARKKNQKREEREKTKKKVVEG